MHRDAQVAAPPLQQAEQFPAAHRGESLAADGVADAPEVDVDVGPACEPARHRRRELGVGVVDATQRLVGEHHAEAERVVRGVPLPDGDPVGRVQLLHQRGEVETARSPADDRDLHCTPAGLDSTICLSTKCCSLPFALRGNESRKRTSRGYLYGARICLTWSWI